tara:strand:+ start:69 stop:422 length:354 start_codon:yes stop_codon:yes gene_type:complete
MEEERNCSRVSDVCTESYDAFQRAHRLEVYGDDLDILPRLQLGSFGSPFLCFELLLLDFSNRGLLSGGFEYQLPYFLLLVFPRCSAKFLAFDEDSGKDLTPASRSCAKVNNARYARK